MPDRSPLGRKEGQLKSVFFAVLIGILMLAVPVLGQLTPDDISALQKQAVEEGWTFTVDENPATQYSLEELCGLKAPADWRSLGTFKPFESKRSIPPSFDWRDEVGMPPVRNQGGCGSCWAFSTVGALECAIKIALDEVVNLSEQWLVSCNMSGWGCGGGWFAHCYHQLAEDLCRDTGPVLEEDFPYSAADLPCTCPYPHQDIYLLDSWGYIGSGSGIPSIQAMKLAIMEYGPISVAVRANSAMQGYTGGIFNGCSTGEINHAVVLVGWDDTQGSNGVWIMRNSWGAWWGEGGYMRIPYGCSSIGYAACYVEYRPFDITVQNPFGRTPLVVDFEAHAGWAEISSWDWDFGDGNHSTDPSPSHEYQEPGYYTVSLTMNTQVGQFTKVVDGLVSCYADTLKAEQELCQPGTDFRVDVYARNYLPLGEITVPVSYDGPIDLRLDSISTVGLRTEDFQFRQVMAVDPFGKSAALRLTAGTALCLDPGEGAIVSLHFHDEGSSSRCSNPIEIVDFGQYSPEFVTYAGDYEPKLVDGSLVLGCCIGDVGNVNGSAVELPDIADMQALVDHLFVSMKALGCVGEADVNQSGGRNPAPEEVDISDMQGLIDHLFINMNSLPSCP